MIAFIEKYFKFLLAFVGVLVLVLAGVSALREHDARILAEQTVRTSEATIKNYQAAIADIQAQGARAKAALQKQAAEVKTPVQAVQEIPKITDAPLNLRPVPDAPSAVAVDAVPLYQELNRGKQCTVDLDTCQKREALTAQILAEKDTEIEALKHPKGFWKRFGTTVKDVGIGVAIGYGVNAAVRR